MQNGEGELLNRRGLKREYWVVFGQLIVIVGSTVALPLWVFNRSNSSQDLLNLVVGFTIFVVVAVAPLSAVLTTIAGTVHSLREEQLYRQAEFGRVQHLDLELSLIQDAYRKLASEERGTLLQSVIGAQVQGVRQHAESCATTRSLEVGSNLLTTEPLLSSLKSDDVCRFVHYCDNHEYLMGPHSLDFFRRVAEMARLRQVHSVRRIIIVNTKLELMDPMTWILATFHEDAPGYEYRLLYYDDYVALQREIGTVAARLDIGLFGVRYLYISSQDPHASGTLHGSPFGRFIFATEEVERYRQFFDNCWKSHLAWKYAEDLHSVVRRFIGDSERGRSTGTRQRLRTVDSLLRVVPLKDAIASEVQKAGLNVVARDAP